MFSKKIFSSKNINLGDHFIVKTFFLDSIFDPLCFLKLCPIFDELTFLIGILKKNSLRRMLILGQKSYFLGPIIFKIPQLNSNCYFMSQNLIFSDEFVGGPNQCEKDDPFCYVSKLKFYSQYICTVRRHYKPQLVYFLPHFSLR